MSAILIIDDEEPIREIISTRVENMAHQAVTAPNLVQGWELLDKQHFDLVFLDVNLPDGNGLEALAQISQMDNPPLVIIITAFGNTQGANIAINSGAWDYLEKPIYKDRLILQIKRALDYKSAKEKQEKKLILSTKGIIGKSKAFGECLEKVAHSSSSSVNVLITGESGTGKELLARLIHDNSSFKTGEYVVVDCASLPETLMETMLFGHKKGSFTSANRSSSGLISMAHAGTLFLDEIGELPLSSQKIFLRVLQEKKYRPVGSTTERSSRFRLISATNKNLKQMVQQGAFRQDLYHRLQTFTIEVPPLCKRKGDIKELSFHYVDLLCRKHELPAKALLPETLLMLESYPWPGNVRELINVIEHAVLTDPALELIYPMQLPNHIRLSGYDNQPVRSQRPEPGMMNIHNPLPVFKKYREQVIEKAEAEYFGSLMHQCGADLDMAARRSGLSKNRIYHYVKKFNLKSA